MAVDPWKIIGWAIIGGVLAWVLFVLIMCSMVMTID